MGKLPIASPPRDRTIASFTCKIPVSIARIPSRTLARVPRDTLPIVAIARIARYRVEAAPRDRFMLVSRAFMGIARRAVGAREDAFGHADESRAKARAERVPRFFISQ